MRRLTDEQINAIYELLKEGKPLPEEYRWLLFEGKQETELIYAGKTREVDVLTETMAVPLQKVKTFGNVKDDEWSARADKSAIKCGYKQVRRHSANVEL